MSHLEVIPIGCFVTIGEEIKASVTGICIRENFHVTYECSWWDGNSHVCKWLEQFEVKPFLPNQICNVIGFKK